MANKIFFWSQSEYEALCNFAKAEIVIDGKNYASSEHYYQSQKTLDPEEAERIRLAPSAYKAKKLTKKITLRPDWDSHKLVAMEIALRAKFSQEPFKSLLLKTGDATLFEDSPYDSFWGTGVLHEQGQGLNHLGRLLMKIRSQLQ